MQEKIYSIPNDVMDENNHVIQIRPSKKHNSI